jgi:capsular polysaccharide biosynthesis protein
MVRRNVIPIHHIGIGIGTGIGIGIGIGIVNIKVLFDWSIRNPKHAVTHYRLYFFH